MTSNNCHPAVGLSVISHIDAVAERIAADWGHHGHVALTEMIAELYADLVTLPAHYTQQQRSDAIAEAADTTVGELISMLDDHIYEEADRPPATADGCVMHAEDRNRAVQAVLAATAAQHLLIWLSELFYESVVEREGHDTRLP